MGKWVYLTYKKKIGRGVCQAQTNSARVATWGRSGRAGIPPKLRGAKSSGVGYRTSDIGHRASSKIAESQGKNTASPPRGLPCSAYLFPQYIKAISHGINAADQARSESHATNS